MQPGLLSLCCLAGPRLTYAALSPCCCAAVALPLPLCLHECGINTLAAAAVAGHLAITLAFPLPHFFLMCSVPWQTDDATLLQHFSQFGAVEEAQIMREKYTGKSRGFGFVTFRSTSEAGQLECGLAPGPALLRRW